MLIAEIVFYAFAVMLIACAVMVIISRNPVHGALFLVLGFIAAAGIWLILSAEFLGLVLVLVYVGAVMTLFLFVVMMMNLDHLPSRKALRRYLPLGIVLAGLILAIVIVAIQPRHFALVTQAPIQQSADYSNVSALGSVLYTDYVYAFEIAAVILLVAIVAAISLAFRGVMPGTRKQQIHKQIMTRREDSIRLVKMPTEKKI